MDPNPRPPDRPVQIGAGEPLAALEAWVAEGRVDEAARARARQRWLERQAAEEASLSGVLLDLAERNRPVTLTTVAGHRLSGPVIAVGTDFGVVRDRRLGDVIVPTSALALVRPSPGDDLPTGDRAVDMVLTFGAALMELAPDRPECVVAVGVDHLRGELRPGSPDVLVVALDGDRRDLVHVSVAAVDHLVVLRR